MKSNNLNPTVKSNVPRRQFKQKFLRRHHGTGAVLPRRAPGRRSQQAAGPSCTASQFTMLKRLFQIKRIHVPCGGQLRQEKKLDQILERVELIPQQVRRLGVKVDDMTESIGEPRVRDLLGRFLVIFDLVDQMGRSVSVGGNDADCSDHVENYRVLRRQVLQVLELNGVELIGGAGRFDPGVHRAVEVVDSDEVGCDGEIVRVFREGFKTGRAVLRFAEVVVKRYRADRGSIGEGRDG